MAPALLEGQLARMRSADAPFHLVCSYTSSACPYDVEDQGPTKTLRAILAYLEHLEDRFDVRPVTLSTAHAAYGRTSDMVTSKDVTR